MLFLKLSNEDIDNILAYTDYVPEPVVTAVADAGAVQLQSQSSISTDIILAVLIGNICSHFYVVLS